MAEQRSQARAAAGGLYRMSVEGCCAAAIGTHGLSPGELTAILGRLGPGLDRLRAAHANAELPLLAALTDSSDLDAAAAALARLSQGARTIVFFGTGGSSLGGQTLAQLAGWNIPGGAEPEQRRRPRTRFYDNLDGLTLERSLVTLDLASTRFVVTSKSGGTAETLVQAVAALDAVIRAGLAARVPELFLGLTEPERQGVDNGLRRLCAAHGIPMLDHHPGIGGRFSALSNVGLLPAMARGLDARAVRQGALAVLADLAAATQPADFAPAFGACVAVGLAEHRGVRVQVMMPYADRLGRFAHWFVQLWAESLGKDGKGTTPLAALGPLDQHSQLQLFMEGAREHLITLLHLPTEGVGPRLDADLVKAAGIGFMAGRAAGDLVAAQVAAVEAALRQAGRPVRSFELPRLDEAVMGALMMHCMLETILAAELMGVDPFGQPGVELAKRLTRQRLA